MKLKVQASIQEDQVRVSGKDKDDLQAVIQMLKQLDVPVELQFVNFRSNYISIRDRVRLIPVNR